MKDQHFFTRDSNQDNIWHILCGPYWTERDKESFFGPLTGKETWVIFKEFPTFGQILAEIGLETRTRARNNGWDFELSNGYSEYVYGKKPPKGICIFSPWYSWNTHTLAQGMLVMRDEYIEKFSPWLDWNKGRQPLRG